MTLDEIKIVSKISDIHSQYYMKIRVKGIDVNSDIYKKTSDSFVELSGCSSMRDASALADEILDEILDNVEDVGNEIVAYMVAKRR